MSLKSLAFAGFDEDLFDGALTDSDIRDDFAEALELLSVLAVKAEPLLVVLTLDQFEDGSHLLDLVHGHVEDDGRAGLVDKHGVGHDLLDELDDLLSILGGT
jgi:hypothetical protein